MMKYEGFDVSLSVPLDGFVIYRWKFGRGQAFGRRAAIKAAKREIRDRLKQKRRNA